MIERLEVLTVEQMREWYGSFYLHHPSLVLDPANVPERFRPLLPYAEFWGISDDDQRYRLVKQAPAEIRQNLKAVVQRFDLALDDWLAGPEAAGILTT